MVPVILALLVLIAFPLAVFGYAAVVVGDDSDDE